MENGGILYVFTVLQTADWGQKIRYPAADDLFRVSLVNTEGRKNKEDEIQSRQKCCLTIPHSSFAASGMENRAELISTWL